MTGCVTPRCASSRLAWGSDELIPSGHACRKSMWIFYLNLTLEGVAERHIYQKPHANLEEVQRGDIHIYIIYSPQNGDLFIHVLVEVPLRGTRFDDYRHYPTLHLFEACMGFLMNVSPRDTLAETLAQRQFKILKFKIAGVAENNSKLLTQKS